MTRDEFMKELAYLLQDIQGSDKEDAVQYYMDYFDEAGPDKEDGIILELGSPERIASIIRSDLSGHLEEGGEFTEHGYQDERFRDPNHQLVQRMEPPETGGDGVFREAPKGNGSGQKGGSKPAPRTSTLLKAILWIILIIVVSPLLLGVGGGVLGLAAGALGLLIVLLLALGVLTLAMLFAGIVMVPYGFIHMFWEPLGGMLIAGIGIIFLGAGALLTALSLLFYGRLIPFLIRSIVDAISRLFHRRRCAS